MRFNSFQLFPISGNGKCTLPSLISGFQHHNSFCIAPVMECGGIAGSHSRRVANVQNGELRKNFVKCHAEFYRNVSSSLKIRWGDRHAVCTAFIFWKPGFNK